MGFNLAFKGPRLCGGGGGEGIMDQPPFSFYLAHGDIHLFESSKEFLAGKRFVADPYVKQAVTF
jgi:Fe-S oxidoreductase